jgi:pimeloyl-ACP methyl ester carboxylesterase
MESHIIDIDGAKTRYLENGKGQSLIILHGWGPEIRLKESFGELFQALSQKMHVIMVALPGFDGSDFPPPQGWNTNQYAQWFQSFLKKLNLTSPVLYGHSFGCRVIVRFLLQHPNFSGKIILTGAAGIKWNSESVRQKFAFSINKYFPEFKRYFRKFCPSFLRGFFIGRLLGAHDWAYVPKKLEKTLQKTLSETDFREELPNIKNQTLLIWGKKDTITPLKSGYVFLQKLPHAQLKVLETGRHGIHRTHPQKIAKFILQFLKKH